MKRTAFLIIDMQNGFLNPESAQCIKMAAQTVPACREALRCAREKHIPIFYIRRRYRADGSDVELSRYAAWAAGGRALSPEALEGTGEEFPEELAPQSGDYVIFKPRWSAFFQTELDLILRRLDIRTVLLAGTTTPNCVRTTCYDALAMDYNVVVLEDCCSSQTPEIQQANMEDMRRAGALLSDSAALREGRLDNLEDGRDSWKLL